MITEYLACGMPYVSERGNGIGWDATTVRLYESGVAVATVAHTTTNERDYWASLQFLHDFPDVTHWWFGGIWTGQVQCSMPIDTLSSASTLVGMIMFDILDTPQLPYHVETGDPIIVRTPYPPFAVHPVNLGLRLRLGTLITRVLQDRDPADTWMGITSLVTPDELRFMLCDTVDLQTARFGNWRLDHGEGAQPTDLHTYWLDMLGL